MGRLHFFVTVAVSICLFTACSVEDEGLSVSDKKVTNCNVWDESYHPHRTRAEVENASYEFIPLALSSVYLGELIQGSTIDNPPLKPLNNLRLDSIDIGFDMPGYYVDRIYPRMNNYLTSLKRALASEDFSGEQTEEFEYDMKQFSDYNELRLAFGANVNVMQILNIGGSYDKTKISHKTGLFARVFQRNFSSMMDYPEDGNLFKNNADINDHGGDAYISNIIYGRLAIISIESDFSYEEVKKAFKASLTLSKVGVTDSIDYHTKQLLDQAEIKVFIVGGNAKKAVYSVCGFDKFQEYITEGGDFTRDQPGVPIFISACRLDDNSMWSCKFKFPEPMIGEP